MNQQEDSQHPHGSTNPRSTAIWAVRYKHVSEPAERCLRFGIEANARSFFERLKRSMHPAELNPVEWVELSVRDGVAPREILAIAPEGGAR